MELRDCCHAALVALVLANPSLPSARPVAVLAGYGTAAVGGLAAVAVAAPGPPAVAVAAGLSLALMLALKAVHPPALAGGCLLALQPADHGRTVLLLIATAAAMALAIETRGRATGRQPG